GQAVWTDLWDARVADAMGHIELSRDRDLVAVVPASADFIAKLANGLADDLLSSLCLARRCPLLVAPALNVEMWQHAATQRNVARLRGDGIVRSEERRVGKGWRWRGGAERERKRRVVKSR